MGSFLFCKRLKINVLFLDGMKRNIMDENRGFSIARTHRKRIHTNGECLQNFNAMIVFQNVQQRNSSTEPLNCPTT